VVGTEGASGVGGDEPEFKVSEEIPGDAADDRAEGAWGISPARVGEIGVFHLPIDDIAAAGAEGAQGQESGVGVTFIRATPTGRDVDRGAHRIVVARGRRENGRWGSRRGHTFLSMPAKKEGIGAGGAGPGSRAGELKDRILFGRGGRKT
jgi:hypothetical protein